MGNDKIDHETLHINPREYGVAFCIRGLKEKAYWMVMTAKKEDDGWYVLKGSPQAFDELADDLLDEIEYKISPGLSARALKSLYKKVSPNFD